MKNIFSNTIEVDNLEMAEKVILGNLKTLLAVFDSSPACMSITTEKSIFTFVKETTFSNA